MAKQATTKLVPERLTFTLDEAAQALGVSTMTVRRAVESGSLPHVLLRKKKLVPIAALKKFCMVPGTSA